VVLGAQFGDEAKGKISDFLASDAQYVVRSGGGPNTGHTIELPEGKIVLHLLACGVLRHGVTGISGPGMVINPFQIHDEILDLERRQLLRGRVVISDRAHVLLPIHELEDALGGRPPRAAGPGRRHRHDPARRRTGPTRTGTGAGGSAWGTSPGPPS